MLKILMAIYFYLIVPPCLVLKHVNLYNVVYQCSKFALAVIKCRGFCRGISPFYSICLSNKNAEAVKFLEIKKKKKKFS